MEFDHLFICVATPAKEGDLLVDFGLTEGSSNQHPGQGTAIRRFFFQNSFIELLYAVHENELLDSLTEPTRLHERLLSDTDTPSPFGVCFRPSEGEKDASFESFRYKPRYLPPVLDIEIANAPVTEPMWFFLSFATAPVANTTVEGKPTSHSCGFKNITSVRIFSPVDGEYSEAAGVVNRSLNVEIKHGEEHLLEVGFDGEITGSLKDFRPALPLIFRW